MHGALLLIELTSRHPTQDVALAARLLTRGRLPRALLGRRRVAGTVLPMIILIAGAVGRLPCCSPGWPPSSPSPALWLWEDLWVKAGQSIPLS